VYRYTGPFLIGDVRVTRSAQPTDKAAIANFLGARKPVAKNAIWLTVGISLTGGLLAIAQAWLVAHVITNVVFHDAGLASQTSWLAAIVVLVIVRAACTWGAEYFANSAAADVQRSLRRELLEHIRKAGPIALRDRPTGEVVSAMTDSLNAIEPFYSRYLPAASLATLLPIAVLVAVLPYDWISALVFVVTAPMIPMFMMLIGAGAERMNQRQWRTLARMSGHLLDAIQGLTTLKIFGASRRQAANVAAMAEDYRRETMKVLRLAFLSSLVLEFFATISIAIVAVLIGFRLLWGDMAFFNGLFVLLIAPEFYLPLRTLGSAYHARMEAIGAGERVVALLASAPLGRTGNATSRQKLQELRSGLVFKDLEMTFPDGRTALDGMNLEIGAGETLALVGPSGGGKSMVLSLLLGFASPSKGSISIDGEPIETIDLESWRSMIAYVPQRPHMFNASLKENIAMRFDGGAIDEERITAAARRAHLGDVIANLPAGLETLIGERGFGLSGGEVQRLALARAFYRDAAILLIDEPTAHLDANSERLVTTALNELMSGRTSIMVAHRLDTIAAVDKVCVIEAGRAVKITTPKEFLAAHRDTADGLIIPASRGGQS
jgi:ATP-binding cassette subfamily C protein CydD